MEQTGDSPSPQLHKPSCSLSGAVAANLSFFAVCIIPSAFLIFCGGLIGCIKVHGIQGDEILGRLVIISGWQRNQRTRLLL